jgi:hypothetical protein
MYRYHAQETFVKVLKSWAPIGIALALCFASERTARIIVRLQRRDRFFAVINLRQHPRKWHEFSSES